MQKEESPQTSSACSTQLLQELWEQAHTEARKLMDEYAQAMVSPSCHVAHPSEIIDQELDNLLHAFR
jgi:uncharacterized Fe-S center protein